MLENCFHHTAHINFGTLFLYTQINKKDLSFLDFNVSCPVFVRMCQNRQYPPRFILEIDGHKATKNADIRVVFHGAKDYFTRKTPILLKIPLARGIVVCV